MFDVTPQERLALVVLSLLLTGGAVARHMTHRGDADGLQFSAESADTLGPSSGGSLRSRVEGDLAEQRLRSQPLGEGERIDPNLASAVQLDRLPGVGPALADRIVAHREIHGRFRTLDDLDAVSGIGPALLERISPNLTLGRGLAGSSRRPSGGLIDVNRATAAELESLPGVGPAIAARIVADRAEHGPFRNWEDLERIAGIGPRLRERIQAGARLGS